VRIKLSKTTIILVLFIIFGAFLRLWQLDSLPAVLHRDETAIAYNAYSLLKTGKDEHGQIWPISFSSFGDYKLPGLIYTTMASVKLFGLNAFATRLPTALAAIFTIPAVFYLSRQIGWSKRISLLASILLSLDFWHIAQARNAYEPILGLFFSSLAWASWLAAWRHPKWYFLALLMYGLGSLFYNVPFLLLPLLFVGSWWILKKSDASLSSAKKGKNLTFIAFGAMLLMVIGIFYLTRSVNVGKTNTTVFGHSEIIEESKLAVYAGLIAQMPSILSRVLNHNLLIGGVQAMQGYVAAFDPTYLFFLGDQNFWHNLRPIGLGDINPVLLIGLLVGLYLLVRDHQKPAAKLTGLYLLFSPLISALTIDAPITNRLLDFHLAVLIIAAVGVDYLYQNLWLKKQLYLRCIFVGLGLVYSAFFLIFSMRYFLLFNPLLHTFWNPGLPEMIKKVNTNLDQYDAVFITSDLEIAYTYFAYYTPFEPLDFQQNAKWHTSGFNTVRSYHRYRFEKFPSWEQLSPINVANIFNDDQKKILILEKGGVNNSAFNKELPILWEQKDWRGRVLWYAQEANLNQIIDLLETLPSSIERARVIDYLFSCQKQTCNANLLSN